MIDTHAHLFLCKRPLAEIIDAATLAGVSHIMCVATNIDSALQCLDLSQRYPMISPTIGFYPSEYAHLDHVPEVKRLALAHPFKAIGEIGLDYYHDYGTRKEQQALFIAQLLLARELSLPVIIHNRHSEDDVAAILADFPDLKKVFHCYSSDTSFTQAVMGPNSFFSFTGTVTYSPTGKTIQAIEEIPLEKMMLETDCPYLTPREFKGQENHPAFLGAIARHISDIKNIPLDTVISQTTQTARFFFSLD